MTPAGAVTTFASGGLINGPEFLAFDAAGNLYVANANCNTILEVTPAGAVSTFVSSSSGLDYPSGLAFDAAGNLFVANTISNTISEVTPAGAVSTFLSSGLDHPIDLAFDAAGNLFITNQWNSTISEVSPAGAVSTFVSSGISLPDGLAFDAAGNLYVANTTNSISEATPAGAVSTFASGFGYNTGLAFDAAGNLYVAAGGDSSTVSKITPPVVTEGQTFTNQTVFQFTDANPDATAADYTAVVTLGDGNSVTLDSSGVVSGPPGAGGQIVADPNGGFDVQLSYTYAEALSNATFSVQVTDVGGATTGASTNSFSVADAGLSATGTAVSATEGAALTNVPLATLTDAAGTYSNPSDLSATINWGDGTSTTPATLVEIGTSGVYAVEGSHTYAEYGSYTISVSYADEGGSTTTSSSTATVADAPLTATATPVSAVEGQPLINVQVATFTDANPLASLSDFPLANVTIQWGDGGSSNATSITQPGGVGRPFDVFGSHTYAEEGSYTVSVSIHDVGGATSDITTFSAGAASTFASGLNAPNGLAFDSSGNLYVANSGDGTVSKVDAEGEVSTFASGFTDPVGLAFDTAGDLYVSYGENAGAIGQVTPSGVVSVFADYNTGLYYPDGLAFDSSGNLYAANWGWGTVTRLTPTGAATTLPYDFGGIDNATGLAFDGSGNLYVSNSYNGTVSKVSTGGVVTVFAAGFSFPAALAFDSSGNLYVVNAGNDTVSMVTPDGVMSTFVSSGLDQPDGLAFDSSGNLYVANAGNGTVTEVPVVATVTPVTTTATVTDAPLTAAATLSTLASFNGTNGAAPPGGLVEDSSGNLFGTTMAGGPAGGGTVFEVAAGSGVITTLASFNGANGAQPQGGLIEDSSGNLFDVTMAGGPAGGGTVFEVAAGSGVITTLASFNGTNGVAPQGGLVEDSSGNLFGTTIAGGLAGGGTVFEVAAGSGVITTLASFNGTNGVAPQGGLVEDSSGNLFGTTMAGGPAGGGTVFEVAAGSGVITTLAFFNGINGAFPQGGLVEDSSGNLFGTTMAGGPAGGGGTVFEVAAGSGVITTLASFNGANGAQPQGGLIEDSSGNLFGTTMAGGPAGGGTVFEVPAGSDVIATLASFNGANGVVPQGGLLKDSSGNLFGVTAAGGPGGGGTVFEVQVAHVTPPVATAGQAFSNQTVFQFADANPDATAADYTAVVTLGDGNSVTLDSSGVVSGPPGAGGQIVPDPNGGFDVQLSYTYAEAFSDHTFSVQVTDVGGATTGASTNTFSVASATVDLSWSGAGNPLVLTETSPGATPTIVISEPSPNESLLEIDLGAGYRFAGTSTTSAAGLTYQNAGSPATSQYATIDISAANTISSLQATLPGDGLTLGPIRDLSGGVGAIVASAGNIEVAGIDTASANGDVDLEATGNLTVDAGATLDTGEGTISLAADVNADGTGNANTGNLSIQSGAVVVSANASANAITLRGYDVNIATGADPAVVGAIRAWDDRNAVYHQRTVLSLFPGFRQQRGPLHQQLRGQ